MSPFPVKSPQEKARDNERSHVLFVTGDPKAPGQIKDRNGEVVLGLCTRCGAAEAELAEKPCVERMLARAAEAFAKLTPLQKAIEFARQRRSWVVGEMQLKDDDGVDPDMSREKAMALYAQTPEGALLAELERRLEAEKPKIGCECHGVADCPSIPKAPAVAASPLAPEREQGDGRKKHYGDGVQPWDVILANGWGPPFAASNVLKYLRRTKNPEHSVESAVWYYARLVEGAAGTLQAPNTRDEWQAAVDRLELSLTTAELLQARGLA